MCTYRKYPDKGTNTMIQSIPIGITTGCGTIIYSLLKFPQLYNFETFPQNNTLKWFRKDPDLPRLYGVCVPVF